VSDTLCKVRVVGLLVFAACGRISFEPLPPPDASPVCAGPCLDPSFGVGGITIVDVGASDNATFATEGLALQSDDKIVIVGSAGPATSQDMLVVRLTTDGSLDPALAGDGHVVFDAGGIEDQLNAVAIQADGKIVVAGESGAPGNVRAIVTRLSSDGTLDAAFGLQFPDLGAATNVSFNGVSIDGSGRISAGGQALYAATAQDLVIARRLPDGGLDPSMNAGAGYNRFDVAGSDEFGGALVRGPTGGWYVGAQSYTGASRSFVAGVGQVDASGAMVTAFGTAGFAFADPTAEADRTFGLTRDAQGRLVVVGTADDERDVLVARFTANGMLDPSFSGDGIALIDRGGFEEARGVVVLADGRIIVAAYAGPAPSALGTARLDVLADDGADLGALVLTGTPSEPAGVNDLDVDSAGRIVVLGSIQRATVDLFVARVVIP
jgi:uncharacterized delta-60 repeat protein